MDAETVRKIVDTTPGDPSHPFMRAVAELLEEHERRLGFLSKYITTEQCKPLAPHRGYYERRKPHFEATPAIPEEPQAKSGGPGVRICPTCRKVPSGIARHALTGLPDDQEEWGAELGGSLDALRTRPSTDGACPECAKLRAQIAEAEGALTTAYMAGAASRRNKGEEESVGREPAETRRGILNTPQRTGSLSPGTEGDCASSPAAPSLHNQIEVALERWGDNLSDERSQEEVVYLVVDAWEAQHRKLREAAQAMCEETPHQIQFLREQGFDGHAAGLEMVACRLEAALKEDSDATP